MISNEAYKISEYVYNNIKGNDLVEREDFENLVIDACKIIDTNFILDDDFLKLNNKEFSMSDFDTDIRGLLSYKGYATIWEGEHEGGLTIKEL